jgi:hypothetical protein
MNNVRKIINNIVGMIDLMMMAINHKYSTAD